MKKNIQDISCLEITEYLTAKRKGSYPWIFSIDCDRTIVNRDRGSHVLSSGVISTFNKLKNNNNVVVVINTGRDLASFKPLQDALSHSQPAIFLSGRVINYENTTFVDPEAVISKSFCYNVWEKLKENKIPFLDVKHAKGNDVFDLVSLRMKEYYGIYKPHDWYHSIKPNYHSLSCISTYDYFNSLDIIRMEIPFFQKDQPELVDIINRKDVSEINKSVSQFFDDELCQRLRFIPVKAHKSNKKRDIAFLRVMVESHYSNKGLGIKKLTEKLLIPQSHVICFGDSAEETASDVEVKKHLPEATLIITDKGDEKAIKCADFLMNSVENDGFPNAANVLINVINLLNF